MSKEQESVEFGAEEKYDEESGASKSDLLERAGDKIEKGLEQSAEFYESKIKPAAKNAARKISDQFQPERAAENLDRAEQWLSRFLKSKWIYLLGVLIAFRPILFGAPILLVAVFLYLLAKENPQHQTTCKRLLLLAVISILAGIALRVLLLLVLLVGAILMPDFVTLRIQ